MTRRRDTGREMSHDSCEPTWSVKFQRTRVHQTKGQSPPPYGSFSHLSRQLMFYTIHDTSAVSRLYPSYNSILVSPPPPFYPQVPSGDSSWEGVLFPGQKHLLSPPYRSTSDVSPFELVTRYDSSDLTSRPCRMLVECKLRLLRSSRHTSYLSSFETK